MTATPYPTRRLNLDADDLAAWAVYEAETVL